MAAHLHNQLAPNPSGMNQSNPLQETPLFIKLMYALGQMGWSLAAYGIANLLIYYYMPPQTDSGTPVFPPYIYQGAVFGIGTIIGLLAFSGRIFDAVTDPLIADWSDRTTLRFGRRRLFMLIGFLPYALFSFLIFFFRQADTKTLTVTLPDVPAGDYTSMSYMIGVDSLKSISDVTQRTGVLDPASYGTDNMYWSWNSGYIFFKMEGISSAATTATKLFQFHIGGFGGRTSVTANNLRTVTASFGTNTAQVRKNIAPTVHVVTDVLKTFSQGTSIAKTSVMMNPGASKPFADGYSKMFKVEHIHNDKM